MAVGPGKYDALCTYVKESAKAEGAVVIVIHGTNGSGFSMQGQFETTLALPHMLRMVADDIEKDFGAVRV